MESNTPEQVFIVPKTVFFYMIIAVFSLAAGVGIGLFLFSERGLSVEQLSFVVRDAVAVAVEQNGYIREPERVDPARVYDVYDASQDDDPFWGPENAEVTIVEFSDFRCSYCGRFAVETLPRLMATYGNKIRFIYRDYPQFGPLSVQAAMAGQCAHDQGKFWEYHNLVFANATVLSEEVFIALAEQVGLHVESFTKCLTKEVYLEEVRLDFQAGQKFGPIGTPTFFINGRPVIGAQPYEVFVQVIDAALREVEADA